MERNSFQQQSLAAAGVVPMRVRAHASPRGNGKPGKADATSTSPLSSVFPTTRSVGPVGFQMIQIPLAFQTAFALNDVNSEMAILQHCLMDFEPAETFGAECSLYGALIHLSSPAKTLTPADRPNEVLWSIPPTSTTIVNTSSMAGNRAIVAIGDQNALPFNAVPAHNRWSFVPAGTFNVPGFGDARNITVNAETVDNTRTQFIHYEYFPAGNFWTNTCQRATLRPIFSPYVHRFPRGRRLRVNFIITNENVGSVSGVQDLFIHGQVVVSLIMGELQTQIPYSTD